MRRARSSPAGRRAASAGSKNGTTDSFTPELGPLHDGLGLLRGSASPHYNSEERRRIVYHREIAAGLPGGIALEDGVAAYYEDERRVEVVTGRDDGHAFAVDGSGERPIPVRVLPSEANAS